MRGRRKGSGELRLIDGGQVSLEQLSGMCSRQLEPYELVQLFANILNNVQKKSPWILAQVNDMIAYQEDYAALCEASHKGTDMSFQFIELAAKYKDRLSAFK